MSSETSNDALVPIDWGAGPETWLLSVDGPSVYITSATGRSLWYEETNESVQHQIDNYIVELNL